MLNTLNASVLDRVTSVVRAIFAGHAGPAPDVRPGDRLVDAGLTSVDMVNLMLALETEFDLMIPPGDITPDNFRSVSSITAMVDRLQDA